MNQPNNQRMAATEPTIAPAWICTLAPLPASYVGRDLQQRHGDLAWRIRFRGDRWLYVVLLLTINLCSINTFDATCTIMLKK